MPLSGIGRNKNAQPGELVSLSVVYADDEKNYHKLPDFLESSPPIISDKIKPVLAKYSPETIFQRLIMINPRTYEQTFYWTMNAPCLDVLSPAAEFYPKKNLKKLVLCREKIQGHFLFTVKGIFEPYLIINLAVAESILRRLCWGITFKKVMLA